LLQFLAGVAETKRTRNLGKHAAGTIDLDQQREVIARLQGAVLEVTAHERRADADAGGGAEQNSLFAAEPLGDLLCVGSHVDVAQSRPNELANGCESLVLKARGGSRKFAFLRGFNRLDGVERLSEIDPNDLRQSFAKPIRETGQKSAWRHEPDATRADALQFSDCEFCVVSNRVGNRGK